MKQINQTIGIPINKPHYKKAFIVFYLLTKSCYAIERQFKRIKNDRSVDDGDAVFSDIHFLLVNFSNLLKLLKLMRSTLVDNVEFKILFKKYIKQLELLKKFRDHLEHIDEGRLDGRGKNGIPLKDPSMMGNLIGENYDFGGEIFSLVDALDLYNRIKSDLINWNKKAQVFPLPFL